MALQALAFGSGKWELFREIDKQRDGRWAPVLHYPSHEAEPGLTYLVSWFGWYSGHVESRNGAHPGGMKHRPPTAGKNVSDNKGHWAIL
jgi:hypothetical protein